MNLPRDKVLWISYLIIGLILLIGTNEQRLYKANILSASVYYPLITSINQIDDVFKVRSRNRILEDKLAESILLTNRMENDLNAIKSILALTEPESYLSGHPLEFVASSVIAYRGSFANRILIIDKGYLDGIEMSYPVISEDGIVGKIINIFPKHSLVLPITSPQFKLGVINRSSSVQGLLEADISGSIYITMFQSGSHIAVGDTITTSSVSTVFPKGFPVGTVSRLLKTPQDVFLRAVVKPFTEVNNLEKVIVVFYKKDLPEESL